jgi:hypothetical protein
MVKKASNPTKEYRSFTLEGSSIGHDGGTYVSMTPGGAAKKIGNKLFRLVESGEYTHPSSNNTVQMIIREQTVDSSHKTFAYQAHKEKLSKPIVRELPNGKKLEITHALRVHALKEHEIHHTLKK